MYCTVVWMHKQFLFDIAEWDTVFFMTSGKLHKKVNGVTLHLYAGNKNNSALKRGLIISIFLYDYRREIKTVFENALPDW